MKLREENMSNIRRRFTAKTGVSLPESRSEEHTSELQSLYS